MNLQNSIYYNGIFIKNGTYIKSKFFRYNMFLGSVLMSGILFKIQHYPGASMFLTIVLDCNDK